MPIIRNPFRRADEVARTGDTEKRHPAAPRSIDIKESTEYKLSEINDSGVYLPPSPTERKNFWSTKSNGSSTSSSNHRSMLSENEPFNISRESFDSYRRSFDISARSPVIGATEGRPRQSLDSHYHRQPPRSSTSFNRPLPTADEGFEDVGLDDPKPKKRGFLSRLTDSNDESPDSRPTSSHHGFHFGTGRKRGQSGQGAELKPMSENKVVVDGE